MVAARAKSIVVLVDFHRVLLRLSRFLNKVTDHDIFLVETLHLVCLLVTFARKLGFTHVTWWIYFVAPGTAHG